MNFKLMSYPIWCLPGMLRFRGKHLDPFHFTIYNWPSRWEANHCHTEPWIPRLIRMDKRVLCLTVSDCSRKIEEDEDWWQFVRSSNIYLLGDSQKSHLCGMRCFKARLNRILEAVVRNRDIVDCWQCVQGFPQVSDALVPNCPHTVKENTIHQTKPSSPTVPWTSYDAHVPTVGAFGSGQGSLWPACSYAAQYAASCNTMCVLTPFYHSPH